MDSKALTIGVSPKTLRRLRLIHRVDSDPDLTESRFLKAKAESRPKSRSKLPYF